MLHLSVTHISRVCFSIIQTLSVLKTKTAFTAMSKESQEVKFSGFLPSLPKEKLLQNYEEAKQKIDVESEDHKEIWEEFSKAVTGCICEIVFSPKISNKEDSDKASALLKNYRDDALLINPKFFNKWIYDFRKRFSSLLDFWKNEMVAKELGPLWTGDFELFDRFDDPEPEVREVLWKLIFDEPALSETKAKQAAELLWAYKVDACFRSPYQYNDWIVTVRDELVKRKFVDFWKIVVDQELGLIGSKESDYFDDMDDPEIPEFYKIGNDNLKMESK
ncbi:uncharacterized protein LOC101900132 [Musca domestica]|uniref:Uncharacterized protein LOC101900132 n=1 Tax=Musca domestica TaxID=7370 RepID=A0A9J7DDH8_MUSDO|nr:uncharacterized protein LOC101900132 [Musca domestica]